MRLVITVFLLFVAYATCYPSYLGEFANSDESDENQENYFQVAKRQGGHNIIDRQSKCEITCIASERNPAKGKGKTIKEAAKVCRNVCKVPAKKPHDKNKDKKLPKRAFMDFPLEAENDDEQQQERREFLDFLAEQFQSEDDNE